MKKHKFGLYFFLLFFIICCAAILVYNINNMYGSARETLIEENDRHLTDLANTVDLNSARLFKDCRTELEYTVSRAGLEDAELELFSGDMSALRENIRNSLLMQERYVHGMLIRFEDTILFCTDDTPGIEYSFPTGSETNNVGICYSSDGNSYITFHMPSESGLEYIVLLKPANFYNEVIVDSIFSHYWIYLYEKSSGLALHNQVDSPSFSIMSTYEIIHAENGYTVMRRMEQEDISGVQEFETYSDGKQIKCRMAVISRDSTLNDAFSVGVAIDSNYVYQPINNLLDRTFMLVVAIVAVAFSIAIYILVTILVKQKMFKKLIILEKEKEVNERLLEQQKELTHHQRMETIGVLTAGIAHEFNNLMTPIMGYSLMILENTPPEQTEIYDNTIEIYNASKKAKDLVSRISKLSGKNASTQQTTKPLDSIIKDAVSISFPIQPNNVKLITDLQCNEPMVCTESQLEHAILNLVINAYQAMTDKGGTLTISTCATEEEYRIKVADTGPGISPEIRGKIFEPFFTTKEAGKGTGLGLSIVQQCIQDHGGSIVLSENEGGGCVFTIIFPRTKE